MRMRPLGAALLAGLWLAGCNTLERLEQVGKPPPLQPVENPVERPGYQAVSVPMHAVGGRIMITSVLDGTLSTFEQAVASDAANELRRSGAIYRNNELE